MGDVEIQTKSFKIIRNIKTKGEKNMCFIKKSSPAVVQQKQEPVERHQADASVTKLSNNEVQGYKQNIKTSAIGLTDDAKIQKKTLLGE